MTDLLKAEAKSLSRGIITKAREELKSVDRQYKAAVYCRIWDDLHDHKNPECFRLKCDGIMHPNTERLVCAKCGSSVALSFVYSFAPSRR